MGKKLSPALQCLIELRVVCFFQRPFLRKLFVVIRRIKAFDVVSASLAIHMLIHEVQCVPIHIMM